MRVYHYNDEKKYLGYSEAYESPLEPGVFFIPANATDLVPQDCPEGYDLYFQDNQWKLVFKETSQEYLEISVEEYQQNLIFLARKSFISFCKENTDNYYIRFIAEGIPVPEQIVTLRHDKKMIYDQYCLDVLACPSLEELKNINSLEL